MAAPVRMALMPQTPWTPLTTPHNSVAPWLATASCANAVVAAYADAAAAIAGCEGMLPCRLLLLLLLLLLRRLNVMDTTDSSITDAMLLDKRPTLDRRLQHDLVDGRRLHIRDARFCILSNQVCRPFLPVKAIKGKHRRRRGFHHYDFGPRLDAPGCDRPVV